MKLMDRTEKVTPETHPKIVAWKFEYAGKRWGDWVPLTPREMPYATYIAESQAASLHHALLRQEGIDAPMGDLQVLVTKTYPCPEECPVQDCLTNKRANLDFKISDDGGMLTL
jgi:hypothetical protein